MQPTITDTIRIESPQHLSEVMSRASESNQPILPVGGGTTLSTGNATDYGFLTLDLTPLSGIDDYIPTDMTASFRAGTSMREVRETLAANGQELPIDLASDDAGTIGGLVATGFSGPRRLGQGTLKDLLIGCEYVRGDGLLAKAGGMTVKNVSGFEISRLLHGSWGSLAVLTRVNLKVLPKSRDDRTVHWHDASLSAGLERQRTLLAALPMALCMQTVVGTDGVVTSARFVGRAAAVDDYLARAANFVGEPESVTDGSDTWVLPRSSHDMPLLICTAPADALSRAVTSLAEVDGVSEIRVSLGTTSLWVTLNPAYVSIDRVVQFALGMWTIEGGAGDWKRDRSVWGAQRDDLLVAKSIKQEFDPIGALNRGRLFV